VGARDPLGIRPLVYGTLDGCPILASETCALDIIGAKYVRDVENGEVMPMPAIEFGSIQIRDSGVTFADIYIFKQWKLLNEPAILIGMDALGLLDTLVIDYRRHELQMRMGRGGAG